MKAIIFSFTQQASMLSLSLQNFFIKESIPCICYTIEKYASDPNLYPLPKPLQETVSDYFCKDNIILFVSACGIAVRSIAPFIQNKSIDPCVLVIDEKGKFVISLLSGHLGGGNLYATKAAAAIGATPIISTATDLNHVFSVDTFARENHLTLSDMQIAKKISSLLLDGESVGIQGQIPTGPLPSGILACSTPTLEVGFSVNPLYQTIPFKETLFLIPKQVVLGIGCKKNTEILKLNNFVSNILKEYAIFQESIAAVTSIDLKKNEPALIALAQSLSVPFVTYDAQTLLTIQGDFTASSFVKQITGVDNVCERATLAYSKADTLFLRKTSKHGMTIAISLIPMSFHF